MQPTVLQIAEDCLIYPYNRLSTLHHLHASFEILMPFAGEVHVNLDSQRRIVRPGELLVLFPGVPHSYEPCENNEGMMLIFTDRMLDGLENDWGEMLPAEPVVRLDEVAWDVTYCLDRLSTLSASGELTDPLAQAYLTLIFVWLVPALQPQANAQPASKDLLYRAMQYMSQNMVQPLSLKGTARALGVNTYYLSHVLNERLHMGFRTYLNALRIDKARRYLRVTSRSIEDIAETCGFTNLRTFDRVFAERCGSTPRDFRKTALALRQKRLEQSAPRGHKTV